MRPSLDTERCEPEAKLYHWGLDGAGVLYPLMDMLDVEVELLPCSVKLFLVTQGAREEDAELEPAVRGWRSAAQLGVAYGDLLPTLLPVAPGTIRKYFSATCKQIERAAIRSGVWHLPPLLVSQPRKGYRLASGRLKIIDRGKL